MRLQKHIVAILEMGDIVAVASQGDTLFFTENYRLYSGESIRITGNKWQYWSQPSKDNESPTFVCIQCCIILPSGR